MILVTGGTGLVGAHLLVELVKAETSVKAIYRSQSSLKKVEKIFSCYFKNYQEKINKIEWITADLNDIPALENAFESVTHVYHCAALISFDPRDYDKLYKINCEGTANIVNISIAKNIQKLCYVSSIATIGKEVNNPQVTEESEWSKNDANVYALTKFDAEMEVWRGSQEGLPVIIVNPGIILGPGFWETGSGAIFKAAAKGQSYYPPGGTGFISVTDVVNIMLLGMKSTINKERFILIAENLSYKFILTEVAKCLNIKPPHKKLKAWQLSILWRLDWFRGLFSSKKRKLTKNSVISLKEETIYINHKVTSAFNFQFKPIKETIDFCCKKYVEEN